MTPILLILPGSAGGGNPADEGFLVVESGLSFMWSWREATVPFGMIVLNLIFCTDGIDGPAVGPSGVITRGCREA